MGVHWNILFDNFILYFGMILSGMYLMLALISLIEIFQYKKENKYVNYNKILTSPLAPTISIIAPAFNEEEVIVDCVRSMLSLHYSNYEVIIINDGSTDDTLKNIIEAYDLEKQKVWYKNFINTQEIRGIYKSKSSSLNKLTVIDKVNGGKSDASNAAINYAQSDYIVCCDVDCILEPDSLLKLIKPVLNSTEKKVIAVGGIVRIVNSCEVDRGKLLSIKIPKNLWARIQLLEYIRSFLFGRMAWSKLNGLLLVSGALGLFDRSRVIQAGGYNKNTIGEDMELIVKMRNQLNGKPHQVSYIPEPLCWTEVPETLQQLSSQRKRWTRGMIQVLTKYKHILFNVKHKTLGLISFPYWVVFEWFAPIIELFGFVYLIYLISTDQLQIVNYLSVLVTIYLFYFLYTIFGIIMESITFKQYIGFKKALKLIGVSMIEPIVYHPIMVWISFKANIVTLFTKNHEWGAMKRKGFKRT